MKISSAKTQNWSAYTDAQIYEKESFQRLLANLVGRIPTPMQDNGRPITPPKDMVFASTLKVYSQFSLRRFMTDLRSAHEKGFISALPCYALISEFMNARETTSLITHLIHETSLILSPVESVFAVDSTGFRTSLFTQYSDERRGEYHGHEWLKLHAIVGTHTNIIATCKVTDKNVGDCPEFIPLIQQANQQGFWLREVLADKAYSSRANFKVVDDIGGIPFVPFKTNANGQSQGQGMIWRKMFNYFQLNQEEFMRHYHQRSNIESTFFMLKSKLGDSVKSRKRVAQENEILLKVLCHNIIVVNQEVRELGITQSPLF